LYEKIIISYSFLVVGSLFAQEAVTAAGSNASDSGGTVSYSIGQVVYTTNSGASCIITQGVQQPYEILTVTGINELGIRNEELGITLYPNPTNDLIKLKIDASTTLSIQSISYQLYDMNGKLLQNKKIEGTETIISMAELG